MRRRPVEAIQGRADYGARCERLVLDALAQLTEAGAPFTVEDVCRVAGVGKTFIYDKRRPVITRAVLRARDASQGKPDEDDTFTFDEMRIALTAFATWLLKDDVGEGHEVELVDRFIQETT